MINSLHTNTIGFVLFQRAHRFDAVHSLAERMLASLQQAFQLKLPAKHCSKGTLK